ncbi:MAG: hypothetical protein K2L87_06245, partial [Clostridiales bacterium]|nr:hypothetical protein [Clostridiales bacterium]
MAEEKNTKQEGVEKHSATSGSNKTKSTGKSTKIAAKGTAKRVPEIKRVMPRKGVRPPRAKLIRAIVNLTADERLK